MIADKKSIRKPIAFVEQASAPSTVLFLDFEKETAERITDINYSKIFDSNTVILADAKHFIKKYNITPKPTWNIICLTTIKHLLSKNIHEPACLPSFPTDDFALQWIKDTTTHIFLRLKKLDLEHLFRLECNVIIATVAMENAGLPFKKAVWEHALYTIKQETNALKEQLNAILKKNDGFLLFGPEPVDLNNATAVKTALEETLGIKLKGTSHSSLREIDHQAVKLLLKYRENARLLSAQGETFLTHVKNDRLRGNYIPIGSASGRFACHEPNLLALPNYPSFQACIVPEQGRKLVRFDYGGFELRILAALSQDQRLLGIFNDGLDIHSMVAEAVFNTAVSKTHNTHLRDQAKVLNFGIIYGMGEQTLASQLKITLAHAKTLMENYFKRFAQVHAYLTSLEQLAKKQGYAKTALNRRAYFSSSDQGYLARIARNIPIQGTGADIIKLALWRVFQRLYECVPTAQIVNLVHDELVIECDNDHARDVMILVKNEMVSAFSDILPNVVPDVSIKE